MNRIAGERDFYKNGYEVKCDRLAKERAEHKKADKLLDAVCVMLIELGAAAFIYAVMSFAHWAEFGF